MVWLISTLLLLVLVSSLTHELLTGVTDVQVLPRTASSPWLKGYHLWRWEQQTIIPSFRCYPFDILRKMKARCLHVHGKWWRWRWRDLEILCFLGKYDLIISSYVVFWCWPTVKHEQTPMSLLGGHGNTPTIKAGVVLDQLACCISFQMKLPIF